MMLARRVVGALAFLLILASLPAFAARRGDTGTSQNGTLSNCPPTVGYANGVCAYLGKVGAVPPLTGVDKNGNPVTVTITLYNWGFYPCTSLSCQTNPLINSSVIAIALSGTDSVGVQSLVIKGTLPNPDYVSCAGTFGGDEGIACVLNPIPDGLDVQEPTPISGADQGAHVNTRWDFGGIPTQNPPPPANLFDLIQCSPDNKDGICPSTALGAAVLSLPNSVSKNKLTTSASKYLVTLTDGTKLGSLAVPASPTTQATNNTEATATVITGSTFTDYVDTSQAYPNIDAEGNMAYPQSFAPFQVPPNTLASCISDTRTFRTVWYSYTPSTNGSVTISTAGSRYDTFIYVFTGSPAHPTTIACDDDPPNSSLLQATTAFNVTQDIEYQIVLGETPTIQVQTQGSPPVGYPLSVTCAVGSCAPAANGALHFSFNFSPSPVENATATALKSSLSTVSLGQSVTFTATVTPYNPGVPTGSVTFSNGSKALGTSPLSGSTATFTTAALPAGANSITATYGSDSNFAASTSPILVEDVLATSTTTLVSSPNPSKPGESVTFTATVTSAGVPTGQIGFFLEGNSTPLAVKTLVNGVAEYKTAALVPGFNSITGVYPGDVGDDPSTSNAVNQYVGLKALNILHSFTGFQDGAVPFSRLAQDNSGNFYGTTSSGGDPSCNGGAGCGAVFEVSPPSGGSGPWTEALLYAFTGTGGDGAFSYAGLDRDSQGSLYGTTSRGGDVNCGGGFGCGTAFRLDPPAGGSGPWSETVLYKFTGTGGDGANPYTRLTIDSQKNLYGATVQGGDLSCGGGYGCGTVFELSPPAGGSGPWTETILHSFTGAGTDGAYPESHLFRDGQGNLYGTTSGGGSTGNGTVFEISSTGYQTLYSFTGTGQDGESPQGDVIKDSSGNLYGTTTYGANGPGILFKLSPSGQETILHGFTGGADGGFPVGDLLLDPKGNLYGTTAAGGDLSCSDGYGSGCGTVYKFSTKTNTQTVLCNFTGNGGDGIQPGDGVLADSNWNLYGTTSSGGFDNVGVVYKLTP